MKFRWVRSIILPSAMMLALGLFAFGFPQVESRAQDRPSEEVVLRAVVEKFFVAYGRKDLAVVVGLWSEKSPNLATYKQSLQQQFASEDLSFGNPAILRVKVESEKASLRVAIALTSINLKNQQRNEQRLVLKFEFAKEDGDWKIWRYTHAAEDLAAALAKAESKTEQAKLLAEDKELVTAELGRALLAQGRRMYDRGSYTRAGEVYALALETAEQLGNKNITAGALQGIANVNQSQGKLSEALEQYQKSLNIFEEIGDKAGIANTLRGIGLVQRQQGAYTRALEYFQKSLIIAEEIGDKIGTSRSQNNIGNVHLYQGNYAQALAQYQKSLKIYEEIGDKAGLASTLNNLGIIHYAQGSYNQAIDHHRKSLRIAEEIGDKAGIGNALNNIGRIHQLRGNYTEALEHYQKSLKISEDIGEITGIGIALKNIGVVLKSQGNYAEALEHYQKSLKIYEEVGFKPGIASTLGNIGGIHQSQGNYAQAMEKYQKFLKISDELGDKVGVAAALNNIGNIQQLQGNYAQALEQYQRSLKLFEDIRDKANFARALGNIGSTHYLQGNYSEALEQFQKSLKMFEESGDRAGIASMVGNIGSVYRAQRNYVQAMEQFQKSLKVREEIGDKSGIANALSNIGDIHQERGNYTLALQFAERAADLTTQIGLTYGLWEARNIRGRAYFSLNQPSLARTSFDQAIAVIETQRNQIVGGEREQRRFLESRILPYHAMVELLIAQNNPGEALIYAERAKARALLDVLASGRVNVTKSMTALEIEQERKINSRLESLNARIFQEKQRRQPDQDGLKQLDSELEKARLDFESFQTNLYFAHPELKTQRGETPPLGLEQAISLVPDAQTALLEFVVAEEKTYLFVLAKSTMPIIKVYPIEIRKKDLTDRVERFRRRMANKDFDFRLLSQELYGLLLKPAEKQLQGKTSLVISPDGPLWDLPFQVLQSERGHYLIERAAISYIPSLSVLREMQLVHKKKQAPAQPSLLALGNPSLGNLNIELVKHLLRDEKFDPLPEAEREVEALKLFYGKASSKVYIGAAAREEVVKQESARYRILHLATHGVLNDASPMYSNVLLSQAPGKSDEDGLLEAWEIMNLDLNADLVVLSACETARGRVSAGEGMIGLSWALFVAGCPRTVASQWKVQSGSTAALMVEFHRGFKTRFAKGRPAISTAESLRRAALKLMRTTKYSHPFYWGGFVVVGDGS